jgi:hypothetical protein
VESEPLRTAESKLLVQFRQRARRPLAATILASLVFASSAAFAQPTDEDKANARSFALQGSEALKAGKPADALDLLKRAETIMHAPTHLLLIARAETALGKLVSAQENYLRLIHEELPPNSPSAFRNAQAAAKEELAAIEPKIASLRIVVDAAAQKRATIKLDDAPVSAVLLGVYRPIDPGAHVIAVFPNGGSPVKTTIELREGEKKEIKLTVPDGPQPSGVPSNAVDNPDNGKPPDSTPQPPRDQGPGFFTPMRGAGLGVAVVGVAGVAIGGYFLAQGFSAQKTANANAIKDGCTGTDGSDCTKADPTVVKSNVTPFDSTAAKDKTIGGVAVGVGAVALAAGVALVVIGKPKPAGAPRAHIVPYFTGTGGGLRGSF